MKPLVTERAPSAIHFGPLPPARGDPSHPVHESSTPPQTAPDITVYDYELAVSGTKQHVKLAGPFHAINFADDPIFNWIFLDVTEATKASFYPDYFEALLTATRLNGGIFDEVLTRKGAGTRSADGKQEDAELVCAAGWIPPGKKIDNPWTLIPAGLITATIRMGWKGTRKTAFDFPKVKDVVQRKYMIDKKTGKVEPHYHMFLISTDGRHRGRGLSSEVIKRFQDKVIEEAKGYPIWTEATTSKSRKVYERAGFRCLEEVPFGEGEVDRDGRRCEGGQGVLWHTMLWRPEWRIE